MKSRKLMRRFLALSILAVGVFSVLSVQEAKAQPGGTFCQSTFNWCVDDCVTAYNAVINRTNPPPTTAEQQAAFLELLRCGGQCYAGQTACYSENAWQSWLVQYNENINSNPEMIIEGPDPICGMFPQMILDCGSGETAEDIEACVMMIQQEQAKFHCP
jgi:hypothetical protein